MAKTALSSDIMLIISLFSVASRHPIRCLPKGSVQISPAANLQYGISISHNFVSLSSRGKDILTICTHKCCYIDCRMNSGSNILSISIVFPVSESTFSITPHRCRSFSAVWYFCGVWYINRLIAASVFIPITDS